MFLQRGRGGPKQSKWVAEAKLQFCSFFGKRSGGVLLPTGPPDASVSEIESEIDMSAESADERDGQQSGSDSLGGLPEDCGTDGQQSPVPLAGDEHIIETLLINARQLDARQLDASRPPSSEAAVAASVSIRWPRRSHPSRLGPPLVWHRRRLAWADMLGTLTIVHIAGSRAAATRLSATTAAAATSCGRSRCPAASCGVGRGDNPARAEDSARARAGYAARGDTGRWRQVTGALAANARAQLPWAHACPAGRERQWR